MSKKTEATPLENQAIAAQRADINAAFAQRDEITRQNPVDRDALKECDKKLEVLAHEFVHHEEFDPVKEPIMHEILKRAKARESFSLRLLLQPRSVLHLHQASKGEKQLPPQYIGINGVGIDVPRGVKMMAPESFMKVLEDSEYYERQGK